MNSAVSAFMHRARVSLSIRRRRMGVLAVVPLVLRVANRLIAACWGGREVGRGPITWLHFEEALAISIAVFFFGIRCLRFIDD